MVGALGLYADEAYLFDRDRGFDIKWVDDNHAIGIFSSAIAGSHFFFVSQPFSNGMTTATADLVMTCLCYSASRVGYETSTDEGPADISSFPANQTESQKMRRCVPF